MKNYLIIGGTKGIGKSITEKLLGDGANVFIIARDTQNLASHPNLSALSADILQGIDLSSLPEVLDGVVYCPGSINLKPFQRISEAEFRTDWEINVMGAVRVLQAAYPHLRKSDAPSVVLFSTVAVKTGMPFHASIAAAKGAIEGLTTSLAAEFAPKIRVNCIAPSLTQTPLAEKLLSSAEKIELLGKRHPLQRVGQPTDIAEVASFLLSDKASWITGQILHVDGGMSNLKL